LVNERGQARGPRRGSPAGVLSALPDHKPGDSVLSPSLPSGKVAYPRLARENYDFGGHHNGGLAPVIRTLYVAALCLLLIAGLLGGAYTTGAKPALGQAGTGTYRFDFGPGGVAGGYRQVLETTVYTKELGYGFEPGPKISCFDRGGKGPLLSDVCTSDKPFFFSVAVPEGNYKVTVTLGDPEGESVTTVKAELRRLMLEKVETAKGKSVTRTFAVNVRTPQIAGGGEVKLKDREKTLEIWSWDEKLTVEFNNTRPVVSSIEIRRSDDVPTIFLLGDSTVCDQPSEPYNSWGQMLTRFFGPGVTVANHAQSGESLRSSLGARRLDKVLSLMKPGDYLFIQFGHNDQKQKGEGVGAFTTYKADLERFVAGARSRGGHPVLVTSMQRRTFDVAGKIIDTHGDYPAAVREVARVARVPLIDLHAASRLFYEALGPEQSKLAFKEGDGTHHNNYGSYELAKCIVEGIKSNKLGIAKYLVKDVPPFDPSHPDPIATFRVPPSPLTGDVKPFGN
jgi:lysophospholipase L1-like esterase